MKEFDYDVIVVGSGFGGPVAAKKCADAGLEVLMLERGEEVGDKVMSGLTIPVWGFLFGPSFIRDGNPPIGRPVSGIKNYIIRNVETNDIEIDASLRIPQPLSPVIPAGYNVYCKPFCKWEAEKAIEAGAELRTSTLVTDTIKKEGKIRGVQTDTGEEITSKIVIDCEGSKRTLATKAGLGKTWKPETIALANAYDYEMKSRAAVDKTFGFFDQMVWALDENNISPPLGYGNGLMLFPYDKSFHFMQDQCLRTADVDEPRTESSEAPNLRELFNHYHDAITSKWKHWNTDIAPNIERLRGLIYETFEIFVGLSEQYNETPIYTDGMLITGDAAGLEGTELCDGVPSAWYSSKYAADVAIDAIETGDVSASFLKKYDKKIKSDPIIQWSTSGTNRYDLRKAQRKHDEAKLRELIHRGWGAGIWDRLDDSFFTKMTNSFQKDPDIAEKWRRMFVRYFRDWQKRDGRAEINLIHDDYETGWTQYMRMLGVSRETRNLEPVKKMKSQFIKAAKRW